MKIPTLLGIGLLIIAISLGVAIFIYQQRVQSDLKLAYNPKKIQVVNITSNQAAITWETDTPASQSVAFGTDSNLSNLQDDDRTQTQPSPRLTHFITLKNLNPDTKYYFKIKKDQFFYPDTPLSFQTAKEINTQTSSPPLRGSIVDTSLNPIDEALVFLKIPNAVTVATFTTTAGNFILPLKYLYKLDYSDLLKIEGGQEATLVVERANVVSQVQISIPRDNQALPPIILGQNSDLRMQLASASGKPVSEKLAKFDLNRDGLINALDVAIVLDNFGKKQKISQADINGDGVVDQKDLDLIKKALEST